MSIQFWVEKVLQAAQAAAAADGVEVSVSGFDFIAVHVKAASAWDGTIKFEADVAGWLAIQGENIKNGSLVISATGTTLDAQFRFNVTGLKRFRARVEGRTVGDVTVTARRQVA